MVAVIDSFRADDASFNRVQGVTHPFKGLRAPLDTSKVVGSDGKFVQGLCAHRLGLSRFIYQLFD